MRNALQVLMALLGLGVALPSAATVITGVDGPLAPAADYVLPYRADGVFDFSSIDIAAGVTLRFDAGMPNVTLLSLGDIVVAGVIDATGIGLTLEAKRQFILTGSIVGDSILLSGRSGLLPPGELQLQPGANLTIGAGAGLPPIGGRGPGGQVVVRGPGNLVPVQGPQPGTPILLAVPEPGTAWLVALVLPMLALLRRRPAC